MAIIDGCDCVMLNKETSVGEFPINAVNHMAKICCEAEATMCLKNIYNDMKLYSKSQLSTAESIVSSVIDASMNAPEIACVVVVSETGKLARLLAKYRPNLNVLGCATNDQVVRQMNILRGVVALKINDYDDPDAMIDLVLRQLKPMKLAKVG